MNILQAIRNNIPNAVTCCNMLSGALACIAAFHAFEPWWWGLQGYQVAFILIAAAAVFDFFDGFTARLLHATSPLGKELDSLSDAVSFGLAPGMVLYNMLTQYATECSCAGYIAMLIPIFGALRLAKFNVSTDQSTTFTGLPIPANAIFWIGFTNLYAEHHASVPTWLVAVLVVAFSLLMVCNLRMFSLKLHSLSVKENYKQYLLVLAFVLSVAFCGVTGLAWAILFYILLSAVTKQD
ncbi:MAG: CDP-diacylglycerol--serine O-phosphatidyltransferase [Bacteroidales bacterium]|nr:CDP-diacylglycerol--serine O-phosphatidyltransferase [Bacteroidales bacterium]